MVRERLCELSFQDATNLRSLHHKRVQFISHFDHKYSITMMLFVLKGTVIRVFAVKDGLKLYDFRRGVKR